MGEQSISDRLSSAAACVCGAKMKTESRGRKCINFDGKAHSYKPSIKNGISNADIHVFCAVAVLYVSAFAFYFIANKKNNHVSGIFQALYAKIYKIGDWKCESAGTPSRIEFEGFSDAITLVYARVVITDA